MASAKKKTRRLNYKRLFLLIILAGFVITAGIGAGFVVGVIRNMPDWQPDRIEADLTTFFYDRDGEQIATRYMENRIPVEFGEIPDTVKKAFLAIEDHQFYNHHGINFYRLAGAVWANLRHGWGTQGGSTITIQLANNAFIEHRQKKLERKIQEAILAIQLERMYSKDDIFEMYLNQIYFGNGAWGVQAAAKTYFGKDVGELDLAESAFLAGVVQRPTSYNPYKYPERAQARRATVLDRMVRYEYISEEEAAQAKRKEFNLNNEPFQQRHQYPYFIDHVIEEAEDLLVSYDIDPMQLYKGGLRVYTTMDTRIQNKIEEVFNNPENFPKTNTEQPLQSAIVVIDPHTGDILGLMGGREHVTQRGLNRATQMKRSPGSVIKPITVYGPALEKGFSPATVIDDVPVTYPSTQKPYQPKNYDGRYRGLITMREAIKHSVNIPAVKMLDTIGVSTGFDFGNRLGLPLVNSDKNLSLALGGLTYGVSPLELVSAYGAFSNGGIWIEPKAVSKITDSRGNVLVEVNNRQHVVMSEETAFLITDMLQSVVESGTGTRARMNRPVAGKTGTTQLPDKPEFKNKKGNQDAWFVGYTPELAAVVWMGYDKTDANHYLNQIYGGRYPAQIWKAVMETASKDVPVKKFPVPSSIVYKSIDAKSGLLPSELTPQMFIVSEAFNKKHVPQEISNVWEEAQVCAETGLIPTPYCPTTVTGLFLKRPIPYTGSIKPEDADLELPTETCTLHLSGVDLPDVPAATEGEIDIPDPRQNDSSSPATEVPSAPVLSGEIVKGAKGFKVDLSWSVPGEGDNLIYSIERWTKKDSTRYSIGVTTENHYSDSKVESDSTYYYRIFAIDNDTDLSAPSNEIMISIND